MTKKQYAVAIQRLIPKEGELPAKVILLIDEAVREYPLDADLWQKRAHLLQVGPDTNLHTLEDALASYFTALYLDPANADIVEDIGHFFDAVMADEAEGRRWFARARKMRRGQQSGRASSRPAGARGSPR